MQYNYISVHTAICTASSAWVQLVTVTLTVDLSIPVYWQQLVLLLSNVYDQSCGIHNRELLDFKFLLCNLYI